MRIVLLFALSVSAAGCVKTDLDPLSNITRADVVSYRYHDSVIKSIEDPGQLLCITQFLNSERSGWTRNYLGTFGVPLPVVRANLYRGSTYVGYLAVGSALSGHVGRNTAFLEAELGHVFARKHLPLPEANRFVELIGMKDTILPE